MSRKLVFSLWLGTVVRITVALDEVRPEILRLSKAHLRSVSVVYETITRSKMLRPGQRRESERETKRRSRDLERRERRTDPLDCGAPF